MSGVVCNCVPKRAVCLHVTGVKLVSVPNVDAVASGGVAMSGTLEVRLRLLGPYFAIRRWWFTGGDVCSNLALGLS